MKLGKEFMTEYATFGNNTVNVEIPFISNIYADGFMKAVVKCQTMAKLKGTFSILCTPTVIVGFRYDFGKNETREYIESIFEIFSGLIMIEYYNQRDKVDIMEIPLAIAA